MIKLTNLGLLMILPLFTMALVASYNSPAYGGGHGVGMPTQGEVLCLPSEVAVIRTTNPQMICVDKTTAAKWEQYGMATIVGGKAMMEESMEEPKSTLQQRLDEIIAKIDTRDNTQNRSGWPHKSIIIFPGRREEPIRAWTIATILNELATLPPAIAQNDEGFGRFHADLHPSFLGIGPQAFRGTRVRKRLAFCYIAGHGR